MSEKNNTTANCKVYAASISDGGNNGKNFSTMNLIQHLKMHQPTEYKDFLKISYREEKSRAGKSVPKQLSLHKALKCSQKFGSGDARAKNMTNHLVEFIALDEPPFSIIDNIGFPHFTEWSLVTHCPTESL